MSVKDKSAYTLFVIHTVDTSTCFFILVKKKLMIDFKGNKVIVLILTFKVKATHNENIRRAALIKVRLVMTYRSKQKMKLYAFFKTTLLHCYYILIFLNTILI